VVLTFSGDTEVFIHLLVRSRGSPGLKAVLLMRVLLPSEGLQTAVSNAIHESHSNETYGESFDRQDRCTTSNHTQPIAVLLPIEDRPRGEGDNPSLDVLRFEFRSSFEGDGDLTSATDDREVLTLLFMDDVPTLGSLLDR
jgi:hypothetical protein